MMTMILYADDEDDDDDGDGVGGDGADADFDGDDVGNGDRGASGFCGGFGMPNVRPVALGRSLPQPRI